jgi:hypothetical protein
MRPEYQFVGALPYYILFKWVLWETAGDLYVCYWLWLTYMLKWDEFHLSFDCSLLALSVQT